MKKTITEQYEKMGLGGSAILMKTKEELKILVKTSIWNLEQIFNKLENSTRLPIGYTNQYYVNLVDELTDCLNRIGNDLKRALDK